jgi:hypothetical protein
LGVDQRRIGVEAKHCGRQETIPSCLSHNTFSSVTTAIIDLPIAHPELVQDGKPVEKVLKHSIGLGTVL